MLKFIIRRLIYMIATLFVVSIVTFIIIQLPPGDFVSSMIAHRAALGELVDQSEVDALRSYYGLGQPAHIQYLRWFSAILKGDLGFSMQWNQPVKMLIKDRLPWSFGISLISLAFVWAIGLGVPNFLLALLALWIWFQAKGEVMVGLFSEKYMMEPWSVAKVGDLFRHLWIPALITGMSGTAGLIRTIRANLLDEVRKPYVMMARARGVAERKLLVKYPLRVAMIPAVSTIGWVLPSLFAGELITSFVMGIPTLAPVFLGALLNQDMFLAGSIVLILSTLTVVGTLVSDILLALVDPRIKESV